MNNSDIDNQRKIKSIDSWMDGDMLFLREQDKIQIRSISERLAEDNPYVALCGPRVDLLNYYFEYLYAKLKDSDQYQLEVFFSVTTDALLDFYNKRLKDISVNAAKSTTDSELYRKILVISDCTGMAKNEWDLLARLLIDFPGANCGLLIICEEPFNEEVEAFFKLLGSRLTQCYCNFPDARELISFLDASSLTPYHSHNKKKLAALGITGSDLEIDRSAGYSDEESIDVLPEVTREKKFNKFLSFTFALVLIVAFGVAYQLNDENAADFEEVDKAFDNSRDDAALVEDDRIELIDDSLDNLSGSLIEKERENGSLPSNENYMQVIDSSSEEDLVEPIVKETSTENLSTETEFKEQSVMIEEDIASPIIIEKVPPSNNTNEIEEPYRQILEEQVDEESKDKLDNSIDPSAFYLQHAALSSQVSASTAATEIFTDFSTAFSLPQFSQTKLWHVVFSGPYATRADAMNVAKENEATADVVIVRGEYIVSRVPSEVEDDGR